MSVFDNPDINRDAILQWAYALESGKYEQAEGVLARDVEGGDRNGFCCLGVLCEVAIANGVPVEKYTDGFGDVHYNASTGELPAVVRDWAGLTSRNPLLATFDDFPAASDGAIEACDCDICTEQAVTASRLNDTYKQDFTQIAGFIRKNLLG